MLKFCANLSMLFAELPFRERFAAAADAGFRAVEILFPYDDPPEEIASLLRKNGLELVLINTPPGDWAAAERGFAAVPGAEDRFRAALDRAAVTASRLGARLIHIMAGVRPEAASLTDCETAFVENLRNAAERLAPLGIAGTIEPLNPIDMPGYVLSNPDQAQRIIAAVDAPNIGFQFDLYHCAMIGLDLDRAVTRYLAGARHIQIAGAPGRNEPDTGNVNYAPLLARIDAEGYAGWIGCEYRPRGLTREGLGWIAPYRK